MILVDRVSKRHVLQGLELPTYVWNTWKILLNLN